ncbi:hypothetical protein [Rhizobium sp. BK176]|uniref:hypothetical protein n=1 Tax=Rhizobium sp. BK176 TaxID=2587071 RepID=UPI00216893A0|nr:hypothetical protein [Rhizobium sp. BK176]MCS4089132.1 hypothetical protein [Rhizobium sp. BK176]
MTILLPEDRPDDHTIGKYFKGDGCIWFCDSYDTHIGYWMTPVYGEMRSLLQTPPERTNVSERAIGRTFHVIYDIGVVGEPYYQSQHRLSQEEREFISHLLEVKSEAVPTATNAPRA